jgi:hypothetical protein
MKGRAEAIQIEVLHPMSSAAAANAPSASARASRLGASAKENGNDRLLIFSLKCQMCSFTEMCSFTDD